MTGEASDAQMRTLLKSLGAPVRGKMKRETMAKRIAELQEGSGKQLPKESQSAVATVLGLEKPAPPAPGVGGCSEEQVLEAVKENLARGMMVEFDEWGWVFRRKARMDSGNMAQPIYNIKKAADAVCQEMPLAKATGDAPRYA